MHHMLVQLYTPSKHLGKRAGHMLRPPNDNRPHKIGTNHLGNYVRIGNVPFRTRCTSEDCSLSRLNSLAPTHCRMCKGRGTPDGPTYPLALEVLVLYPAMLEMLVLGFCRSS